MMFFIFWSPYAWGTKDMIQPLWTPALLNSSIFDINFVIRMLFEFDLMFDETPGWRVPSGALGAGLFLPGHNTCSS